jgi:hypothetical protein
MQWTCSRSRPRQLTHPTAVADDSNFFNLDDPKRIFREHTNLQWHFEELSPLPPYYTGYGG